VARVFEIAGEGGEDWKVTCSAHCEKWLSLIKTARNKTNLAMPLCPAENAHCVFLRWSLSNRASFSLTLKLL
jgi:hypothetical protein